MMNVDKKKFLARFTIAVLIGLLVFSFISIGNIQQTFAQDTGGDGGAGEAGGDGSSGADDGTAGGTKSDTSTTGSGVNVSVEGGCPPADIACWMGKFFQNISILLGNFALQVIGTLLNVAVYLAELMMNLGKEVLTFPTVTNGFKVSLSLVNVLFVSAIILMAFATMFRWQKFSLRNMFLKLVLAALLINFSFLIAGVILDASNVLTDTFIFNFNAEEMGRALQPQQLTLAFLNTGEKYDEYRGSTNKAPAGWYRGLADDRDIILINREDKGWTVYLKVLMGLTFSIVAQFVLMLTMFAVALMLVVRNIWIAFLLILMPLAWGAWLLPRLSENWSKWWDNFIKWVIYLPSVAFFLFLAITTTQLTIQTGFDGPDLTAGSSTPQLLRIAFQLLLTVGILFGGLKAAQSMSLAGGKAAMAFGAFIGRNTVKLGRTGAGLGIRGAGQLAKAPGEAMKTSKNKFVKRLGSVFALPGRGIDKVGQKVAYTEGGVAKSVGGVIDKMQKGVGTGKFGLPDRAKRTQAKIQKIFKEEYSDKNEEQLLEIAKRATSLSFEEQTALARALKDKKVLDRVEDGKIKEAFLKGARETKSGILEKDLMREFSKYDPDFAADQASKQNNTTKDAELEKYLQNLKADKLAEIKLEKIKDADVRGRVIQAILQSNAALGKKAGDSSTERNIIEEELLSKIHPRSAFRAHLESSPDVAYRAMQNDIQTAINHATPGNAAEEEVINKMKAARDAVMAYHRVRQTPGQPGTRNTP
ncbi:MAG: hypothetical protein Q8P45_02135 [Candidatus Harrisonbacteria bacterium]|nr:hypothetical protein [Candidatus Harrisonbacteria bacterium]